MRWIFSVLLALYIVLTRVQAQSVSEVVYNGSSFTPQSVTAKVGDSVQWRNTSSVIVHVASDPHPAHNLYPFLNIGSIPGSGGTAGVVLNQTGTFTYHNHLNSNQTGTIIVQNPSKPGDANADSLVDGRDYIIWLNHYDISTTLGAGDGDFNSNGTVNGQDYIIWLNNYGK